MTEDLTVELDLGSIVTKIEQDLHENDNFEQQLLQRLSGLENVVEGIQLS